MMSNNDGMLNSQIYIKQVRENAKEMPFSNIPFTNCFIQQLNKAGSFNSCVIVGSSKPDTLTDAK